jgi:cytochrome c-type biogenesis protein CcmH/NrfF
MQGFNWLAWITPFAALAMAGATLIVVIRRRAQATAAHAGAVVAAPGSTATDAQRARLERELAEFDRES